MKYIFTIIMLITLNLCAADPQNISEALIRTCKCGARLEEQEISSLVNSMRKALAEYDAGKEDDDIEMDLNPIQITFLSDLENFIEFAKKLSIGSVRYLCPVTDGLDSEEKGTIIKGFTVFQRLITEMDQSQAASAASSQQENRRVPDREHTSLTMGLRSDHLYWGLGNLHAGL